MLLETTGEATHDTAAGTLKDEAAIVQTWVRLTTAWGRGDAAAMSALFDRECDHRILSGGGRVRRGREEFDREFRSAFAQRGTHNGRTLKFSLSSVRFISAEVAILDGTLMFAHGGQGAARQLPCGSEPFTAVMKLQAGTWLIAACRVGALVPVQ